jgi:hypothetical protein
MIVSFVYLQLRIGWDDLDYYPKRKTWRGLFVVVSIGYIPVVAMAGLVFVLEISKLFF